MVVFIPSVDLSNEDFKSIALCSAGTLAACGLAMYCMSRPYKNSKDTDLFIDWLFSYSRPFNNLVNLIEYQAHRSNSNAKLIFRNFGNLLYKYGATGSDCKVFDVEKKELLTYMEAKAIALFVYTVEKESITGITIPTYSYVYINEAYKEINCYIDNNAQAIRGMFNSDTSSWKDSKQGELFRKACTVYRMCSEKPLSNEVMSGILVAVSEIYSHWFW